MNRNKLKQYAPQARRDFIAAVTNRAAHYGMTKEKIDPITEQGEVVLIGGKPFPRTVVAKRRRLEARINRIGFEQVMEAMAYTWFNRLVAIRYMELHGYLDHGYRVLSPSPHRGEGRGEGAPEIVEHAEHVDLPGLETQKVIDLKLDGTKEAELYRMLLVAQCNALHSAMPFLFERINDETELLLPDNLLHSDSLIRKLVNSIDEEDWQEVEIIGWLYQFYISEKKDEVIGKVVKSEDIPAATQLFTPNWIVKYLVQNSLGRQWMATYPDSRLKEQMEFYIEPAEQTPEVQAQLKEITPDSLNPEELTLLDPACGSGHILVEAYDLLKAIYLERGYRARDIPRLILEKNLYGLEIDDRAAQLAAFALMMKAREDDRRIFSSDVKPHVLAIQESKGLDAKAVTGALNTPILKKELPPSEYLFKELEEEQSPLFSKKNLAVKGDIAQEDVAHLIELFQHGKTFGSLIRVPKELAEKLPVIAQRVEDVIVHGEMFEQVAVRLFKPLVEQARALMGKYDAVVANPPYLNSSAMDNRLKVFVGKKFPTTKSDLFSVFIERNCELAATNGFVGFMTPFVWMFLKSYEKLRESIFETKSINFLIHPEYHAFFDSAYVPVCSFILRNCLIDEAGEYFDLSNFYGAELQPVKFREAISNPECGWRYRASSNDFRQIPGSPVAYWVSEQIRSIFERCPNLRDILKPKQGTSTGNDEVYVRFWFEIDWNGIGFGLKSFSEARQSCYRYFPLDKGGEFRKWYGNNEKVIRFDDVSYQQLLQMGNHLPSKELYFRRGLTWSKITSGQFSIRYDDFGFVFSSVGLKGFPPDESMNYIHGLLSSCISTHLLKILAPTLSFLTTDLENLPLLYPEQPSVREKIEANVQNCVRLAQLDWDSFETSWDFGGHPILTNNCVERTIESSYGIWRAECHSRINSMRMIEEENNRFFSIIYGLQDELSLEVSKDQITLYRPDQREDIKRLISYAIGCMMGRYSLDKPGLIYAHRDNQGFDSSQYQTFSVDDDGIIPITDDDWFPDDAANRVEEFIATTWPKEHLEENLKFIAESLGPNRNEQPRETIRRYLATGFYKHHLSMYKRRPIYWLFSSGKQRAFQCLVYLHRYNEGTLSRMRTEYVIPLQGKIASRIGQLEDDIAAATSTSHRKRLEKERDKLLKQQAELQTFDEKLRHYADRRISLDLDDGVKVNYGKFADLLAEVKSVTGGIAS